MIFNKDVKCVQWGKNILFKRWWWDNRDPHAKDVQKSTHNELAAKTEELKP